MIDKDPSRLLGRLRFRHLQLLAAIDDRGSLRAAAEALNLTQPALSKSLKELEDMFGMSLFDRTSRGLKHTAQGEILIHGARLLIDELRHVQDEAQIAGPEGRAGALLRIGVPQFVGVGLMPYVLKALTSRVPPMRVTLREDKVPRLFGALLDGGLDALLTVHTPESHAAAIGKMLCYEKVSSEDYAVAAHPSHPLTRLRTVRWQQLAREPWVLMLPPALNRVMLEQSFLRAGVVPPLPLVECDSPITNVRLAAQGIGLTLIPGRLMREAEQGGSVKRIHVSPGIPDTALSLIYRASAASHPRISSLHDALQSIEF